MLCGCRELEVLREGQRGLLEHHHYLGQEHDPTRIVAVCANCHIIISNRQGDDRVPLEQIGNSLERFFAMASVLGSHLRGIGDALTEWADRGRTFVEGLDREFPDWWKRPWAK